METEGKGEKRKKVLLLLPGSGMMGSAMMGLAMDRKKEVGGVLRRGRVRPRSRGSSIRSFEYPVFSCLLPRQW